MYSTISDIALDLGVFALDNELRSARKRALPYPRMRSKIRQGYTNTKMTLKQRLAKTGTHASL